MTVFACHSSPTTTETQLKKKSSSLILTDVSIFRLATPPSLRKNTSGLKELPTRWALTKVCPLLKPTLPIQRWTSTSIPLSGINLSSRDSLMSTERLSPTTSEKLARLTQLMLSTLRSLKDGSSILETQSSNLDTQSCGQLRVLSRLRNNPKMKKIGSAPLRKASSPIVLTLICLVQMILFSIKSTWTSTLKIWLCAIVWTEENSLVKAAATTYASTREFTNVKCERTVTLLEATLRTPSATWPKPTANNLRVWWRKNNLRMPPNSSTHSH